MIKDQETHSPEGMKVRTRYESYFRTRTGEGMKRTYSYEYVLSYPVSYPGSDLESDATDCGFEAPQFAQAEDSGDGAALG